MKKRFAIILTAAALSMTGCSLLGQDTYYIDQGMEQINSGNYEEALTSFSSAEQEGKHLVESYRGSGMAYMALGEYDKAVEAFDRAVDLTKEKQKDVRKDILMYKATALYQSGDYEGAAKVCDTIQTCLRNSSRHSLFPRQLTRQEDGSILCLLSPRSCSSRLHIRMLSFLDTYRMKMARK